MLGLGGSSLRECEDSPVALYRVTYRPELDREPEDVEADAVTVEGGNGLVVLRQVVMVIGRPREVVIRRLRGGDVVSVEPI
jgi:hypothetical protein